MKNYEATEVAYNNGYKKGYEDGKSNAVEVVHGRWEKCSEHISKNYFRCSSCKMSYMDGVTGAITPEYGRRTWRYCPHCGAKMDGERKENG